MKFNIVYAQKKVRITWWSSLLFWWFRLILIPI